ncbi:MAG: efflux RND transporter periplasmic adaptor subunit [Chitinophagales bacterium]|nr:efflux RND transporter periplasmic adaptor subunit [Chitinophagales bacterium]
MQNSSWKLIILLAAFVAILATVAIVGKKQGWIGGGNATEVTVEKAGRHTIEETVSASGKIFPETEVKISPDVSGEIVDLFFEEGDSVKKGDLLFTIRPDTYQSIVEQAEAMVNQSKATLANANARIIQVQAQYENAKTTFDRNIKLYQEKVLAQADYDNAVAAFKSAEGELKAAEESVKGAAFSVKSAEAGFKEAQDNLTKTKVYAPMEGILSKLNVKKGERVVGTAQFSGTEMLTIADLSKMEVQVDVSENDIVRVSLNDTVELEVDAFIDKKFKGIVRHIANSASTGAILSSEQVTNFTVKISVLPDSYKALVSATNPFPFKPGMSATAEIKTDLIKDALSVSIQCVTIRESEEEEKKETEKEEIVFVHENGKAKSVKVKTGIQDDKYIQIKEGVDETMAVVTGPYRAISRTLKNGDKIEVVKELKKEEE